jgi:hypothetical protein
VGRAGSSTSSAYTAHAPPLDHRRDQGGELVGLRGRGDRKRRRGEGEGEGDSNPRLVCLAGAAPEAQIPTMRAQHQVGDSGQWREGVGGGDSNPRPVRLAGAAQEAQIPTMRAQHPVGDSAHGHVIQVQKGSTESECETAGSDFPSPHSTPASSPPTSPTLPDSYDECYVWSEWKTALLGSPLADSGAPVQSVGTCLDFDYVEMDSSGGVQEWGGWSSIPSTPQQCVSTPPPPPLPVPRPTTIGPGDASFTHAQLLDIQGLFDRANRFLPGAMTDEGRERVLARAAKAYERASHDFLVGAAVEAAGDFRFDKAMLADNVEVFVQCGRDFDEMVRRRKAALAPDRISAARVNAVIHPENPMRAKVMRLATLGMPAGELMPPRLCAHGPLGGGLAWLSVQVQGSSSGGEQAAGGQVR